MAVGMIMELPGGTQELYDSVSEELDWKGQEYPDGFVAHYAGPSAEGWFVFDVWETQEHFEQFAHERLMPALQKTSGMDPSQGPAPRFVEIYNEDHAARRVEV